MTPSQSKGRVLICDDERGIRDILTRLVRLEGYEALEAADGLAALAAVREQAPDVLLLDIRMPWLDGIEVLQRVRVLAPTLPVIMVTTSLAMPDTGVALASGVQGYLLKPFRNDDVIRSLRHAMNVRRNGGTTDGASR